MPIRPDAAGRVKAGKRPFADAEGPSRSQAHSEITSSQRLTTSLSCVASTMALPVFASFLKMSITMSLFFGSREPVGSSARTILPGLVRQRANATLCCSPPESSATLLPIYPASPTLPSDSAAICCFLSLGIRRYFMEKRRFFSTVADSTRAKLCRRKFIS